MGLKNDIVEMKRKLKLKHLADAWILLPILLYLLLFFFNSKIQALYGSKCERNFIVRIDTWLFSNNIYPLMEWIQNPLFDVLSAVPYLIHFPLPFAYISYLLLVCKDVRTFLRFVLAFGIVCSVSVVLQSILPTPPPWMLTVNKSPPEAGFSRVDALFNIKLFNSIYSNSPLKCGAFPSLHTSWPCLILFTKPWISKWFALSHASLIAFAAIYSTHHFVIDVAFGVLFAWLSCQLSLYTISKKYGTLNTIISIQPKEKDEHITLNLLNNADSSDDERDIERRIDPLPFSKSSRSNSPLYNKFLNLFHSKL